MKHLELINQFRQEIASLAHEVESSVAMGHYDLNKVCEEVFCGLFRELYALPALRNLNADEKVNFPGIDLADDAAKVAIQVTSDRTLSKIQGTLEAVVRHRIYERYNRFIVYVLTKKQESYSDQSLKRICGDKLSFDVKSDVLDYRDLSQAAATADPAKLKSCLDHLRSYTRGHGAGLGQEDFDPPETPAETLGANLVELYFPTRLFTAEILPEVLEGKNGRPLINQRKAVGDFTRTNGIRLPSDYEVSGGRLITFHDLEASNNPFRRLIDEGSVDPLTPRDYYEIDADHERVFKSLLRFMLQHKLFQHHVRWQHQEGIFIFLGVPGGGDRRTERWTGQKVSSRMVYERKFKRDKPAEVLSTRHLAFSVDFLRLDGDWYISLTPDWFFSYGPDYGRSRFGDRLLSGLKRMEKNRSVYDQFRFLASWLENIDEENLFSEQKVKPPSVSFSAAIKLGGGRRLDEQLWEPLLAETEDELQQRLASL